VEWNVCFGRKELSAFEYKWTERDGLMAERRKLHNEELPVIIIVIIIIIMYFHNSLHN
jgi:hypothetical protein